MDLREFVSSREFVLSVRNRISDADAVFSREEMARMLSYADKLLKELQAARGAAAAASTPALDELFRPPPRVAAEDARAASFRAYCAAFIARGLDPYAAAQSARTALAAEAKYLPKEG